MFVPFNYNCIVAINPLQGNIVRQEDFTRDFGKSVCQERRPDSPFANQVIYQALAQLDRVGGSWPG